MGSCSQPSPRWVERRDAADVDETGAGTWRQRYDAPGGQLMRSHRTGDGTLLVEGFAARPGVLTYRDADGHTVRELVLPEELHQADSLATLGRVPLTLEHPDEDVTPDNVGALGVGDVDSVVDVSGAGGFVRVRLAVRRRDALRAIERGKVQLSPGYRVRVEPTAGTHPVFGPYDAIQRERRYNHLALVDQARGGPTIRLRADGAAMQLPDENQPPEGATVIPKLLQLLALLGADPTRYDNNDVAIDEIQRRVDALTKRADAGGKAAQELTALQDANKALQAQVDDLTRKLATITGVADALKAKVDAAEAEAQAKADAAERASLAALAERYDGIDVSDSVPLDVLRRSIASAYLGTLGAVLPEDAAPERVAGVLLAIPAAKSDKADNQSPGTWGRLSRESSPEPARQDAANNNTTMTPAKAWLARANEAFASRGVK